MSIPVRARPKMPRRTVVDDVIYLSESAGGREQPM